MGLDFCSGGGHSSTWGPTVARSSTIQGCAGVSVVLERGNRCLALRHLCVVGSRQVARVARGKDVVVACLQCHGKVEHLCCARRARVSSANRGRQVASSSVRKTLKSWPEDVLLGALLRPDV